MRDAAADTPEWAPWPEEGESWLIPCAGFCENSGGDSGAIHRQDKLTFSSGGVAEFERLGLTTNWIANSSGILISGEDLPVLSIGGLHLGTSDELSLLHFLVELEDESRADAAGVIRFDPDAEWGLDDPPVRLVSLINERLLPDSQFGHFVIQLDAGGGWTGNLETPDAPIPGTDPTFSSWEVTPEGRVRIERMVNDVLFQVREWELIQMVGDPNMYWKFWY